MEETSSTRLADFRSWLGNWRSLFPIVTWLPNYPKKFLASDVVAGVVFASFALPQSMAYATLAGLPVQTGIYCVLAAGLFFAFFTTAKQLPVAPTSAISLMVGTTVATLSGGDLNRWIAIAELSALVVAAIYLLAFIFKLSSLVSFISENILLGFKAGAALSIMSTQFPKVFGVKGGGDNFVDRILSLFRALPETNVTVLVFGIAALLLLIAGDKFLPGRPVSILVVIGAIVVVSFTSIAASGIKVTGDIPSGLPSLGRPSLRLSDVDGVVALAFACFLMGYIETISAARTLAIKNNYEVNPRQELLALGAANIATAFSGGYPVAGGLSQASVLDKAGAKSPLSLIFSSVTLIVLLLFFTGLLKNLPDVVLAVIVIQAVAGLIKIDELKRLWSLSKLEFLIAMIALIGVLLFGILKGVMIAAILSIAFVLRRTANPNVAVLGRIGHTDRYSDISRHPDNTLIPGVNIFRVEASFLYFNVDHIRDEIRKAMEKSGKEVKLVILDMSASPYVDVAGSKLLLQLSQEFEQKGISFKIVEALSNVRDLLRKQGMEKIVGHISRKSSINEEVLQFKNEQ